MKVTELRIGNYININDVTLYKVDMLYDDYVNLKYWKPIPLTEEWLVKFGFVYDADSLTFDYEYNHFVFYLERDFKDIETFSFDSSFTETKVKYVHQLQNLYFALTNKEL